MAFLNEQGLKRLWSHIVAKVGTKADAEHDHDDLYYDKDETLGLITVEDIDDICALIQGEGESIDPVTAATKHWVEKLFQQKGDYLTETDINTHNTSTSSHNDIRLLIENLARDLHTLADCDDETLNQMHEVVNYIQNNQSLIDGITTSKVSVSDIINNLTTTASNKPLSAAQGIVLKALIDELSNKKVDKENFERIVLRCSEIGMTPNDDNGDNFTLLCNAIVRADKVLVDGMYTLTNTSIYTLNTNIINIIGETLKSGFDVSNCRYLFDVADSCVQLSLKNLTFTSSSNETSLLFRKENYVAPRMDFVEISGCSVFGNISPIRFYQSTEVNPEEVRLGVDVIRITDNKVYNCRCSFAVLSDVSFNMLEVSGNIVRNFDYAFITAGTTNESPYANEITLSKHMALIHDNDVYCDCATNESDLANAWWGSETNTSYYVFFLYEGERVHYYNNKVEGMKAKNAETALYDAYLSAGDVIYEHNVWKNNVVLNSAAINNNMMKAKAYICEGCRKYYNNIFIVEEDFFTLHGMTVNDSHISMISNTSLNSWDVQNNVIKCPTLYGFTSSSEVANMIFKNNTLNVGAFKSFLLAVGVNGGDVICDSNTIICENGVNAKGLYTGKYVAKRCIFSNNIIKNFKYPIYGDTEELQIYNNTFIDDQQIDGRLTPYKIHRKVTGYNNKIIKNNGIFSPFGGMFTENIDYVIENCTHGNSDFTSLLDIGPNQNNSIVIEFDGSSANTGLSFSGKIFFETNNGYFRGIDESDYLRIQKIDTGFSMFRPKIIMAEGSALPFELYMMYADNVCRLYYKQVNNEKLLWTVRIHSNDSYTFVIPENIELPSEYQQVSYIETDDGNYIDTGVRASNYQDGINYTFDGNLMSYNKRGITMTLFGASDSGKRSGNVTMGVYSNTPLTMLLGGSGNTFAAMHQVPELGKDFTIEARCTPNTITNSTISYNGEPFTILGGVDSEMPNVNIMLFWINGANRAWYSNYVGKLYKFTMSEIDGTPIRNFIPCYRVADNVVGLYDTVGGQFYTNAGTGSFIAGPLLS